MNFLLLYAYMYNLKASGLVHIARLWHKHSLGKSKLTYSKAFTGFSDYSCCTSISNEEVKSTDLACCISFIQ